MKNLVLFLTLLGSLSTWSYSDSQVLSFLLAHPEIKVLLDEGDIEKIALKKTNSGTSWDYIATFQIVIKERTQTIFCDHAVSVTSYGGVAGNFLDAPVVERSQCRVLPNHLNPDDFLNPRVCGMGGPLMVNEKTGECIQSLSTCTTANLRKAGFRSVKVGEQICSEQTTF